ncbi:uncharacterized protein MELLADRAFT_110083 [Melampsora larici-populina 98AG31]|uniref:Uncharacterized protein n=1 Tax=Melampsora larici-populina (strain 98AG31 / pathotype 3-4-7) TaxID=747676 RepID=F4RYL4_MELLP|nr:uncharacterized protein MELLADRAFT_110083 [Melampsora larici-populina 98AG31]EGG02559.1 hypothetical protein MELLADRAFT_110083 [Melampsora larici-populina 98AG31]
MSSVTSERPARVRKQTSHHGSLVPPSPDLSRRVTLDNIILAPTKSRNKRKRGSTVTIVSTEDEESDSVTAGEKQKKIQGTINTYLSDSEASSQESPVVTKKNEKERAAQRNSSKTNNVSRLQSN